MYDYKTEIPARLIDEEKLSDLVGHLTKHMGAESHIEMIYVVSVDTGEVISAQALNKRIASHEIPRGTILVNGRDEKFQIAQGEIESGPFVLQKEPQS